MRVDIRIVADGHWPDAVGALWGPENPCLISVKALSPESSA
jgi:hypothetical protein